MSNPKLRGIAELSTSLVLTILLAAASAVMLGLGAMWAYNEVQKADHMRMQALMQAQAVLDGDVFAVQFNQPVVVEQIGYGWYDGRTGQEVGVQFRDDGASGQYFNWRLDRPDYNLTYVIARDPNSGARKIFRWRFVTLDPATQAAMAAQFSDVFAKQYASQYAQQYAQQMQQQLQSYIDQVIKEQLGSGVDIKDKAGGGDKSNNGGSSNQGTKGSGSDSRSGGSSSTDSGTGNADDSKVDVVGIPNVDIAESAYDTGNAEDIKGDVVGILYVDIAESAYDTGNAEDIKGDVVGIPETPKAVIDVIDIMLGNTNVDKLDIVLGNPEGPIPRLSDPISKKDDTAAMATPRCLDITLSNPEVGIKL